MPNIEQLKMLGQEVRRLRKAADLTGEELGRKIGRTQSYVSAIENLTPSRGGEPITPTDEVIEKLGEVFDIAPSYFHALLGRSDESDYIDPDKKYILDAYDANPQLAKQMARWILEAKNNPPLFPDDNSAK